MERDKFWELISCIDIDALNNGDEEGAVENLVDVLSSSSESEINLFQEHLSIYLYSLDGKKWCNESGESGDSDDGFLYARCYVIANGEEHYKKVLSNPNLMPKSCEQWAESLLYVAPQAWAEITNNDEEDYQFDPSVSYETGSNGAQW